MARRYSYSSSHHNRSRTPYDATLLAADRILSKEREYQSQMKKIHAQTCMIAEKIGLNGDVEKALLGSDDATNPDESAEHEHNMENLKIFLNQQRERVKKISADNVERLKNVDYFVQALGSIRDDIRAKQHTEHGGAYDEDGDGNPEDDEDGINTPPDYRLIIEQKIKEVREKAKHNEVRDASTYDHKYCREVRERLGEKEKKRNRSDEDDELEIITTNNNTENSLKCPVTGMLYENPLKNKFCGHVYSEAGFQQMLHTRRLHCPHPGCPVTGITKSQLEADYEMEMRVKRHLNRIQREKEAESQNMDDEDEYDEGGEAAGMTVIS